MKPNSCGNGMEKNGLKNNQIDFGKWAGEVNFQNQVLAQSVPSPNQAAVPL